MMEMKVATSLTLYSFSCCTIKHYYYYYYFYYYIVLFSRDLCVCVCSFFRSLVSAAFQKKKKRKETVCVIISISKTRFSHVSSRETNTHTTLF